VVHAAASRISWDWDEYWRADLLEAVKRLAKSRAPSARYGAAYIIGDTSMGELEDILVDLMKDRSPRVRARAHKSLHSLNPARLRKLLGL